ncbi:MAG: hypothetical protein JNL74_18815 [Fibrobacteres bacterium]|nr:hypothetical protein [Fibrobacterota bacterium]
MRIKNAAVFLALFLFSANIFAQLDLKEKAQLMGVQIDERDGTKKGVKKTDVSFIFTGKPTQYFHIFRDSTLELQFYDAVVGDEKLQDIAQAPFMAGGTIATERLNVNKDIEGLSPLFKDVVRVVLPIEKGVYLDFTVSDDFNVITLKTDWSKTVKVGGTYTTTKTKTKAIILGSVVIVTGGVIGYVLLSDDNGGEEPDGTVWQDAGPPPLPTIP